MPLHDITEKFSYTHIFTDFDPPIYLLYLTIPFLFRITALVLSNPMIFIFAFKNLNAKFCFVLLLFVLVEEQTLQWFCLHEYILDVVFSAPFPQ